MSLFPVTYDHPMNAYQLSTPLGWTSLKAAAYEGNVGKVAKIIKEAEKAAGIASSAAILAASAVSASSEGNRDLARAYATAAQNAAQTAARLQREAEVKMRRLEEQQRIERDSRLRAETERAQREYQEARLRAEAEAAAAAKAKTAVEAADAYDVDTSAFSSPESPAKRARVFEDESAPPPSVNLGSEPSQPLLYQRDKVDDDYKNNNVADGDMKEHTTQFHEKLERLREIAEAPPTDETNAEAKEIIDYLIEAANETADKQPRNSLTTVRKPEAKVWLQRDTKGKLKNRYISAKPFILANKLIDFMYQNRLSGDYEKILMDFPEHLFMKIGEDFHVDEDSHEADWSDTISAFAIAVARNHYYVAKMLAEHGAKADIRDVYGYYPIHYAVRNGNDAMMGLIMSMLKTPAKCNEMIKKNTLTGYNVLHMAAMEKRPDFFEDLATQLKNMGCFTGEELTNDYRNLLDIALSNSQSMVDRVLKVFPNLKP